MKKIITAILLLCLSLGATLGLIGCGGSSWKAEDVTLKNHGAVVSQNGFIAETDNYVYFVNGVSSTTVNNSFGAVIKGSLAVADKSDLSKSEIVVPKVIASKDFKSSFYLDIPQDKSLGRVFFVTPTTDKDSSGEIATSVFEFASAKLDGTDFKQYFKVASADLQYRFAKAQNGDLYVVYYDSEEKELVSYNFNTQTKLVIAKTDEKAEEKSLSTFKFADVNNADDMAVAYTVTVYKPLKENQEEGATRESKAYNLVYAYKVGDDAKDGEVAGKLILDGSQNLANPNNVFKFDISLIESGKVFYKSTDTLSTARSYVKSSADFYAKTGDGQLLTDTTYVAATVIINGLDEVYALDSETKIIKKTSMFAENRMFLEADVTGVTNASTLLFVSGDFIYYFGSNNELFRYKIANVDESVEADTVEQLVASTTVTSGWFKPAVIGDKIFYCNTGNDGKSYIFVNSVDADVERTETACSVEDHKHATGENFHVTYNLQNAKLIGKATDEDYAIIVADYIEQITMELDDGRLVYDTVNAQGEDDVALVMEARAFYDALPESAKKAVDEYNLMYLEKFERAIELGREMRFLSVFNRMSKAERDALKTQFDAIKVIIEQIEEEDTEAIIRKAIPGNANADYESALEYFYPETDEETKG